MATLAKLTSLSTQTLSLLLERQRLQTISAGPNATSLHLPQITRNLQQLRTGILDLEAKEGRTEAVKLLRSQYERMRGMLGPEGDKLQSLQDSPPESEAVSPAASSSSLTGVKSPSQSTSRLTLPDTPQSPFFSDNPYTPYADDPDAEQPSTHEVLQSQRQTMDEQDVRLDQLSYSIGRQRDISLQINDELDVHHGLLEEMDEELDRTDTRLLHARRSLDRVAKGAKENSSAVMIGIIIFVLLILIIVFKT
ncbi:hypothetical protein BDY19DRAFT_992093 [Irpex rosettiformis]|uniref:Uncharacterized protein n=1 Tax=Irpex rosettiformis TaxID=378272 RepID=A0ACB8U8U5_9APHY|nr:hypothetical protein BDY19DRAFT_992093 [Irpex rosettiformis]